MHASPRFIRPPSHRCHPCRNKAEPPPPSATRVIVFGVQPGKDQTFTAWQNSVNNQARQNPACLGIETLPPKVNDANGKWVVIYRYRSETDLKAWLDSPERNAAFAAAPDIFTAERIEYTLVGGKPAEQGATLISSHQIIPGMEAAYQTAHAALNAAAARFPGFAGYEVFPPTEAHAESTVMLRFDTQEHMNRWLESPERAAGREALYKTTLSHKTHVVATGFGSWFAFNAADGIAAPAWKQAMVVLGGLFPTVMLLNLSVGKMLSAEQVPFAASVFVGNLLGTMALTWLVMPVASRLMHWWLSPRCGTGRTWLGLVLLVALYAGEIGVFLSIP